MSVKLLQKETQVYTDQEVNTGEVWLWNGKEYPIYRKFSPCNWFFTCSD